MTLWRISEDSGLDGTGGLVASARWHTRGQLVVYCALNPPTSLVEVLVHLEIDAEDIPEGLQYLEISVPDTIPIETVAVLPDGWRGTVVATRAIGNEWLASGRTALLKVPSVVAPETWNVLINPRHSLSREIQVSRTIRHGLDSRLSRRGR